MLNVFLSSASEIKILSLIASLSEILVSVPVYWYWFFFNTEILVLPNMVGIGGPTDELHE